MGNNYYDRRNIYSDEQLVACYLKYVSQIKAANELGVSRETVARAVRRAGIRLNGRRNVGDHKGNNGGGSQPKITDAELIAEAKIMSRVEIAEKHKMNVCNIDRRAKRLGIACRHGVGTGGTHHKERARAFGYEYDRTVTLCKVYKRDKGVCKICGKPTDIRDIQNGHIGRLYPTIDHIVPMSKGGPHTWKNVQLAHMYCNSKKCDSIAAEGSLE